MNPVAQLNRLFVLVLMIIGTGAAFAQLGNVDATQLEIGFKEAEVEFKKYEIVSNPAKVKNNSNRPVRFYIEASVPPSWNGLGASNRTYQVNPGDSMFVPFRVIPKGQLVGNTKYAINIMVRSEDGLPIGTASFFCYTKKIVKWEMSVLPEDKIYFKNGEQQSEFAVSMLNIGNYEQDFQMTLNGGQREDLVILDSMDNIIRNPSYTVSLDASEDTTMHFKVQPATFKRNHRSVSLINHKPLSELQEQRFRLYAISEEAKQVGGNHTKKGAKIDFIKLANEQTVSPYGTENIPLIAEAQIQNILSDFSFMSLNLRGIKQIDEDRRFMYFTQLQYSQSYFNPNFFDNIPWYVGYFDKKWDIQAGQVNGRSMGVLASGKGVTGSYQVLRSHRVGAHFTQTPGFNNARTTSFGVYHDYTGPGTIRVSSTLARSQNTQLNLNSTVASSRVNARIIPGQNVSLLVAGSLREYTDTNVSETGYLASLTYSGIMLDKKLRAVVNARYNTPTFGSTTSELLAGSNRTTYDIRQGLQLQLLNNVNIQNRYGGRFSDTIQFSFRNIFNRLNLSARTDIGVFQPGVFYDITEQALFTLHYRGVQFNYSTFDFKRNALITATMRMGYNNALEYPEIRDYFTAQFSLLARIKTFTVNSRFNYGPANPIILTQAETSNTYPQQFRTSIQHQYMFRNTRFILQSGANYSYNNTVNSHTASIFPEMFYYSTTGWRFSVNVNYTFNSTNFQSVLEDNNTNVVGDNDDSPTINNTVRVGASIRREFGIPVPFTKVRNYDLDFTAFYDLNGNGEHERNEPTIENVVIRLSNSEVITNSQGKAKLNNMPKGNYAFVIIPLDATSGWFPEIPDSLFVNMNKPVSIPFVRGIKLFGSVVMDRDKLVTEADERFDLSNIKITAVCDGKKAFHTLTGFDGSFEMYLPNGTYVITFDENVLSQRFRIMQNNISVSLDRDLENIHVTFFIVEKRRKVNIKRFGGSSSRRSDPPPLEETLPFETEDNNSSGGTTTPANQNPGSGNGQPSSNGTNTAPEQPAAQPAQDTEEATQPPANPPQEETTPATNPDTEDNDASAEPGSEEPAVEQDDQGRKGLRGLLRRRKDRE